RAGAAGHDPADLHVTDAAHGVADRAAAVGEQAELGVPAAVQVGVDAFDVGQLRARGDAAVEGVHEQPALGDLARLLGHQAHLARAVDAERADLIHRASQVLPPPRSGPG